MSSAEESLRVVLRVKPLLDEAVASNEYSSALSVDTEKNRVTLSRTRKGNSEFSYYGIVGASGGQADLYSYCNDVVADAVSGVNCSIIAYGQTGSGKTFSMLGKSWTDASSNSNAAGATAPSVRSSSPSISEDGEGRPDDPDATLATHTEFTRDFAIGKEDGSGRRIDDGVGIIPRCLSDIYATLNDRACKGTIEFSIHVQVMQIYNEKIFDLLQDRRRENPLSLRENNNTKLSKLISSGTSLSGSGNFGGATGNASGSVYVQGLSEYRVDSREEILQLLKRSMKNRAVRSTEMNLESSRSHTILQLSIEVRDKGAEKDEPTGGLGTSPIVLRKSIVRFVDLAGSEKWRQTLSQAGNGNADMQKEQTNINTSLHVLGNCVSALTESGRKHIPYRDSVLTRILQDSLGGGGRTVLVATVSSPVDAVGLDETHSTLQFANRASKIKVTLTPHASIVDDGLTLAAARAEIAFLRDKVAALLRGQAGGMSESPGSDLVDSEQQNSDANVLSKPSTVSKGPLQSSHRSRRKKAEASSNGSLPPPSSSRKARKKSDTLRSSGINTAGNDYNPNGSTLDDSCCDDLENSFVDNSSGNAERKDLDSRVLMEQVENLTKANEELRLRLEEYLLQENELRPAHDKEGQSVGDHDTGTGGVDRIFESCAQVSYDGRAEPLLNYENRPKEEKAVDISSPSKRTLPDGKNSETPSPQRESLCEDDIHSVEAAMIAATAALRTDLATPPLVIAAPSVTPHSPPYSRSPMSSVSMEEAGNDRAAATNITNDSSPISKNARTNAYSSSPERDTAISHPDATYNHVPSETIGEFKNDEMDSDEIRSRPRSAPRENKTTSSMTSDFEQSSKMVYMASSTAPTASNGNVNGGPLMASPVESKVTTSNTDLIRNSRNAVVQNGVASRAEARLVNAVEYGKHVIDTSPPSPVKPLTTYGQGSIENTSGGMCARHGLAACILCQLGGIGNIAANTHHVAPSAPVYDRLSASSCYSSLNFSVDRGGDAIKTKPSPYIAASQVRAVEQPPTPQGGPCNAHGVSSCVLCALRGSLDGPPKNTFSGLNSTPQPQQHNTRQSFDKNPLVGNARDSVDPVPAVSPLAYNSNSFGTHNNMLNVAHQYNSGTGNRSTIAEFESSRAKPLNRPSDMNFGHHSPPRTNESGVNIGTRDEGGCDRYAFENSSLDSSNGHEQPYFENNRNHEVRFSERNEEYYAHEDIRQRENKGHRNKGSGDLDDRDRRGRGKGIDSHQPSSILDSVMASPYVSSKDKAKKGKHKVSADHEQTHGHSDRGTPSDSIQLPSLAMAAARHALSGSVERYANIPRSDDPGSFETGRASFEVRSNRSDNYTKNHRPKVQYEDHSDDDSPSHGHDSKFETSRTQHGVESWKNITYVEDEDDDGHTVASTRKGPEQQGGTRSHPIEQRKVGSKKTKTPKRNGSIIGPSGNKKKIISSGYGAVKPKR